MAFPWGPIIAAGAALISSAFFGPEEQEQPQQMAGSLFQPTQLPPEVPFQPMGLPPPPNYQGPPAIAQFPPFQPLFGQRRDQ